MAHSANVDRIVTILFLPVLVAGCLRSKEALITKSDHPFPKYVLLQQESWDTITHEWKLGSELWALTATSDGYRAQQRTSQGNGLDAQVKVKKVAGLKIYTFQMPETDGSFIYASVVIGNDGRWYARGYSDNGCSFLRPGQVDVFHLVNDGADCIAPSWNSVEGAVLGNLEIHPNDGVTAYRVMKTE